MSLNSRIEIDKNRGFVGGTTCKNTIGGVPPLVTPDTKENNAGLLIVPKDNKTIEVDFEIKIGIDLAKRLCRECLNFTKAPTAPNVGTCPFYKENDEFQLFPADTWISCLYCRPRKTEGSE